MNFYTQTWMLAFLLKLLLALRMAFGPGLGADQPEAAYAGLALMVSTRLICNREGLQRPPEC